MARASRPKQVGALRHSDRRVNIPTAEMQSFFQREEDHSPLPPKRYERQRPLAQGEHRERDPDRDPQLLWNGMRITLTEAQRRQLAETGEIEIGEAQLVWRGKDNQDWSDLIVQTPPLYIQEKIHPKAIIDDLRRRSAAAAEARADAPDLFADFNGVPKDVAAEFYQHEAHWSNRMISGDSLSVMASLAERERLKGKVQCIYFDPPYGQNFSSNWQVSTRSREVKDTRQADISREPEQVKAFRDTWKDGIHSYLTYLRDRLTVARDLLTDSGSIFVQIGDENVHRVRAVMDEVFRAENFVSLISIQTTTGFEATYLGNMSDFVIWYAKDKSRGKTRPPYYKKTFELGQGNARWLLFPDFAYRGVTAAEKRHEISIPSNAKTYKPDNIISQGRAKEPQPFNYRNKIYDAWTKNSHWKASYPNGMQRLAWAGRLHVAENSIQYIRFHSDFEVAIHGNIWTDTGSGNFTEDKVFVVQTNVKVVERCILMTTDPGDLVLDPTCGSGTTAYVAEQWGRRWITIDTSRVALALARTRLMAARYPWYLLADSPDGRRKGAELTGKPPLDGPTRNDLRQGFVYERAPHIKLEQISNNSRIDDIYEKWQATLEPLRAALNAALGRTSSSLRGGEADAAIPSRSPRRSAPRNDSREAWEEWEIPRETGDPWPANAAELWAFAKRESDPRKIQKALDAINEELGQAYTVDTLPNKPRDPWPEATTRLHTEWWQARIARQQEIDAAIAQAADVELLYDSPYADPGRVRVAGPFTVESLSPHRIAATDEGELADDFEASEGRRQRTGAPQVDFSQIVIDYLKSAGIHQSDKSGKIDFDSVTPWPGQWIGAEGRFQERDEMRRAAILIGPEYGTVSRPDLTAAAREANETGFDMLIACAFNFDAHSSELDRLGPLRIVKARMNPDLHMADELKNTGKGNLFVVFGEPDINVVTLDSGELQVTVKGVDVYDPNTGDIRSNDVRDIAAWFIDTDYNEESFFVRHAYFLGANDPYKALKAALRAEIDEDAWATLYRATSRPFSRPRDGVIAVKVINHFGDEVMKVYRM